MEELIIKKIEELSSQIIADIKIIVQITLEGTLKICKKLGFQTKNIGNMNG